MTGKKRFLADAVLFLASMIWGVGYYLQKMGSESTTALTFNLMRYMIAAALLLILSKFRLPPAGAPLKASILTGFLMFLAGNLQQFGLQTASISNASFITSIYIVLVPFLARLILKRKISPHLYLAALLSLAGLYLITTRGNGLERISRGDVIVFICAIFWALQILAVDRGVSICDPVTFTTGQFVTAVILQLLAWITIGHRDSSGISQSWPYAAASGIIVMCIASIMQSYGQKNTGETEASIIMGLESIFGTLSGVILYHEQLKTVQVVGMVLIFAAVLIAVLKGQETGSREIS